MKALSSLPCWLLATATFAAAQTAPDAPLQADRIVVEAIRLTADAEGVTHVRLDDTAAPTLPSLTSLASRVANLHIDDGGAGAYGSLFSLRGLVNTPYFSDPSVTLYFDDLPLGSSFTYPTGLFGFSSATVARGPQGTAFGRGGEGGTILLSTPVPTAVAGGEIRLSGGNFAERAAALTAQSSNRGKVDATVQASFDERDGYIANPQLHTRVDDQHAASASARIRYRPTAASEFTLQLLGNRQHNGAQPLVPLGGPLFSVDRGREGTTDIEFGGVALKAAFDTALGRLSATTSYTHWQLDPYSNRLVLPPPLDSSLSQTQRSWNEEIRLASAAHAALVWNVGAWFSDSRTNGNIYRAIPDLFPIEASTYELNARTAALFGETVFTPATGWRLTAGLRAETVRKDFDRSQTVPGPGRFTADQSFDSVLPKLAASYALSADTTASASVSVGTKPGGWSAYTGNAALASFRAERATAFETGIDTAFAQRTVKLAARVFAYDIHNYQIERSFSDTDYLVVNAPRARSLGGELEATWRPIPEWTLSATFGLTDITLREFTDPFTGIHYDGNRAPAAPRYDGNLSATWHAPSGWFAGAELWLVGRTYFDESENPAFAAGGHALLNARLGYDTARWRVSVYGENLTDKGYYTLIIPGVGHGVPGAPRTYGVEVAVKW